MRTLTITCDICGAPAFTAFAAKVGIPVNDVVSHEREGVPMMVTAHVMLANSDGDNADLCVRCRADLLRKAADVMTKPLTPKAETK